MGCRTKISRCKRTQRTHCILSNAHFDIFIQSRVAPVLCSVSTATITICAYFPCLHTLTHTSTQWQQLISRHARTHRCNQSHHKIHAIATYTHSFRLTFGPIADVCICRYAALTHTATRSRTPEPHTNPFRDTHSHIGTRWFAFISYHYLNRRIGFSTHTICVCTLRKLSCFRNSLQQY